MAYENQGSPDTSNVIYALWSLIPRPWQINITARTTLPSNNKCEQFFNNPCSLRRHKYSHLELKFPCRSCSRSFPFESDLVNHHLKHQRHPGYQCNHQSEGTVCGKWFFAKSDLTRHIKTHSGKIHLCMECDYTTYDIRYLIAHRYTH